MIIDTLIYRTSLMLVQSDEARVLEHIKKGFVVQNSSYMPIQKSLDQIAKTIVKVDKTLETITECLEEKDSYLPEDGVIDEPQNPEKEDYEESEEPGG